jgi:hypothetical protein
MLQTQKKTEVIIQFKLETITCITHSKRKNIYLIEKNKHEIFFKKSGVKLHKKIGPKIILLICHPRMNCDILDS